jgi:hypothetical protein
MIFFQSSFALLIYLKGVFSNSYLILQRIFYKVILYFLFLWNWVFFKELFLYNDFFPDIFINKFLLKVFFSSGFFRRYFFKKVFLEWILQQRFIYKVFYFLPWHKVFLLFSKEDFCSENFFKGKLIPKKSSSKDSYKFFKR